MYKYIRTATIVVYAVLIFLIAYASVQFSFVAYADSVCSHFDYSRHYIGGVDWWVKYCSENY